jgi:hypothetical protein
MFYKWPFFRIATSSLSFSLMTATIVRSVVTIPSDARGHYGLFKIFLLVYKLHGMSVGIED